MAKALAALCIPEDVQVVHLRERFRANISDIEWIEILAAEQNWSVVTRDRLTKNPLEKEALRRSGLTAFILTKAWGNHTGWETATQLVRWWPRIMEQSSMVTGGAAFEVPWRISGKGKFQQLKL